MPRSLCIRGAASGRTLPRSNVLVDTNQSLTHAVSQRANSPGSRGRRDARTIDRPQLKTFTGTSDPRDNSQISQVADRSDAVNRGCSYDWINLVVCARPFFDVERRSA